MILITFFLLSLKALHTNCNILDVDYLPSSNVSSLHDNCDLSLVLSITDISIDLSPTLLSSILYWIHSHIFTLIDSSFLYDIDEYTDDFWSEFYLHLDTLSNETSAENMNHLSIDICGTQTEVLQIIRTEATKNDEEIAAYVRYKLMAYIQTHHNELATDNLHVSMMIVNSISSTDPPLFAVDATSDSHSTQTAAAASTIEPLTDHNNESSSAHFVLTENMFYVAIIGFFMIITSMIVTVLCVLCIKQITDKRLEQAIKEIGNHNNRNTSNKQNGKALGATDMTSIEPIPIPNHLASIDTGLHPHNILEEVDDQSADSSINIQRNKLGLKSDTHSRSKRHILSETESHHDVSEIEHLNTSPVIDDILSSSPSSIPNTVFLEDGDYRRLPLHSMSARLSNHLSQNKKDEMNIIYSSLPNKYTYAKRHSMHSIVGKQYAKRKESNSERSERSKSKPNLRCKSKRSKPKMHNSHSQRDVLANKRHKRKKRRQNGRYSLQLEPAAASYSHNDNNQYSANKHYNVFSLHNSNSLHELSPPHSMGSEPIAPLSDMNKKSSNSLSVNHNMMLYEHKESVDVDAIEFVNGKLKINMNRFDSDQALQASHPPIPNPQPQHMNHEMANDWDSESESSTVYKTNTTKGTPDAHHSVNISDAHSNDHDHESNVCESLTQKIAFTGDTPPPPPPPVLPPPISLQSNYSQTVIIRMSSNNEGQEADADADEDENEKEVDADGYDIETKCEALSLAGVQSNVSRYYQPNL